MPNRSIGRRCLLRAIVLSLLSQDAIAQTIQGTVRDAANTQRVAGAVVQLVDSAGNTIARALTNERGEYRVSAAKPGTYRLRALRIGYLPVASDIVALHTGDNKTVELLAGVPLQLDTVRVVSRRSCRFSGDSGHATFAFWEQARTAFAAAQIAAADSSISATTLRYVRALDPTTHVVRGEHAVLDSGLSANLWQTITRDSLRQFGYVVTDKRNITTYYAPDLEILLSDEWIAEHCFRLIESKTPGVVAIEFEPTRERSRVPEIRGTLWMDRRSAELRRAEFGYVNVSRAQDIARGEMEFVRLADHGWAISRWQIRAPVLTRVHRQFIGPEIVVAEIREIGGELALASRGNDTLWTGRGMTLPGAIVDSVSGDPIPNARVSLVGTSLSSITDHRGRFAIRSVLPGKYVLEARTASLDSIGSLARWPLSFADTTTVLVYRVPSANDVLTALCGRSGGSQVNGMLTGFVRVGADSATAREVRIVAEWLEAGPEAQVDRRWRETRVDHAGRFRICDLPRDVAINLTSTVKGFRQSIKAVIPADRLATRVELTLEASQVASGALAGLVLSDSTNAPIADAQVSLPALAKSALTNSQGAFRIVDIPVGEQEVVVRRLGYAPVSARIAVGADETVQRRIYLKKVVALDTVSVVARAVIPSFEEHRRLGLGRFLTRDELAKYESRRLAEALSQLHGLRVHYGNTGRAWVSTTRGLRSMRLKRAELEGSGSAIGCFPVVYLDNMILYGGKETDVVPDVNRFLPSSVEAVEYYAGPAQIPLKYSSLNTECGVLVLHTRRSP